MINRCTGRTFWVIGLAAILSGQGIAETTGADRIGQKLEAFSLMDSAGKEHSVAVEPASRATVVLFLGTECPLVSTYSLRMQRLHEKWSSEGVRFIGINSNLQDSVEEIAEHARELNIPFPVVKDPGNKIADQFAARRTPEAFLLDADLRIRYQGRIDDQFGIGYQRPAPTQQDLDEAISAVLAGGVVPHPKTEVQGCLIGRVPKESGDREITYAKQVSRILQQRCVECHHEGEIAPFSLTSYDETIGWAEMIREVVDARRMPPWLASPVHTEFSNNPSLTDEEKETLFTWIDNGCPEGDPADLPEPLKLAKDWTMSKPDQVFYMSDKAFPVPAEGVVDYQYYSVDPGNTEDLWISEAEVRAGEPSVVHHVIVFIRTAGDRVGQPQMAYAPGMPARKLPKGHAIKLPAGAKLIFQVHYTPNGIARNDRSFVGFKYAKPEDVTHEVIGGAAGVMLFVIPPNNPNYQMTAWEIMKRDTIMIGMNPHMHVRGKAFKYELVHPDGRTELLLDVPRYDFNWQLWYNFKEPKLLPKGSKLVCTAVFDNSTENPSNPDPTQAVTWGEQTWDEMMFGFYSHVRPRTDQTTDEDEVDTVNGQ